MIRLLASLACASVLAIAPTVEHTRPDFSGKWRTESNGDVETLIITQTAEAIVIHHITTDSNGPVEYTDTTTFDGQSRSSTRNVTGGTLKRATKAEWSDSTLVFRSHGELGQMTFDDNKRWTLAEPSRFISDDEIRVKGQSPRNRHWEFKRQ